MLTSDSATHPTSRAARTRLRAADVRVDDLAACCEVRLLAEDVPHADRIEAGIPVYEVAGLGLQDPHRRAELEDELAWVIDQGPGVYVMAGAFADHDVIDAATAAFTRIIEQERAAQGPQGDHFGAPGANARIWNAQEKLARIAPDVFVEYFGNEAIALGARAWLGPAYQMTSQVNLVYPGGQAQQPHRDYHLGFQSNQTAEEYPAHVHRMSPYLTLQGAVAHGDMPVVSGPTMLLPNSQRYELGYLAYRDPAIKAYFADHMVQLPLAKGDVVYFSPALLHGAGTNRTPDVHRLVNLLQVSSAFGRAMESLDRTGMCEVVYPELLRRSRQATWSSQASANVIAATAEGYPFPTNLDSDQPIGGLAPRSQASLVTEALEAGWDANALSAALRAQQERARP